MKLDPRQKLELARQGFVVLPELFTPDEIDLLRSAFGRIAAEDGPLNYREKGGELRTMFALHQRDEAFRRLVSHPRLLAPAQELMGDKVYVQQAKINLKLSFAGELWQWHQDFAHWHAEDEVPEPHAMNFAVFLDDVTEFNSPIMFIPGSHRYGLVGSTMDAESTSYPLWTVEAEHVSRLAREHGLESAKGKAGSALLFSGLVVHGSAPNISPFPRRIFSVVYNAVENRKRNGKRPDHLHHGDTTPLAPLADDCLAALTATGTAAA
jgi:ectoine hydroxylase